MTKTKQTRKDETMKNVADNTGSMWEVIETIEKIVPGGRVVVNRCVRKFGSKFPKVWEHAVIAEQYRTVAGPNRPAIVVLPGTEGEVETKFNLYR